MALLGKVERTFFLPSVFNEARWFRSQHDNRDFSFLFFFYNKHAYTTWQLSMAACFDLTRIISYWHVRRDQKNNIII